MTKRILLLRSGLALVAATLASCSPDGTSDPLSPGPPLLIVNATASKTAVGFREQRQLYDWSLAKEVTPTSAHLAPGASASLSYVLTATRSTAGLSPELTGVRGEICVTNPHSSESITNLSITDQIEALVNNVSMGVIASAPVNTSANSTLSPGETGCYPYEILFTPVAGATYWNEALITGTNLLPRSAERPFTLPAGVSLTGEEDEGATLADVLVCPTGFTCAPAMSYGTGSWVLTGSSVISYQIEVTNSSAPCSSESTLENTATLTEGDSGTMRSASASVVLTTRDCDPPSTGSEGCTPGYWKQSQHFGNWVGYVPSGAGASLYEAVFGVDIFPGSPTLLEVLGMGGGGVKRFGRHSAAALLNAAGTVDYGMTPAQVIAAVQAAVVSGDFAGAADLFEAQNERGCPLGRAE